MVDYLQQFKDYLHEQVHILDLSLGVNGGVTGLFLFNENTIGPVIDQQALVLREASGDRK